MLFSATPRGARLARHLAVQQLMDWGLVRDRGEQIVAELANNAVLHGRVPGRDFRLTLALTDTCCLRIEVTDARADRLPLPPRSASELPAREAESGRGLLLVEVLADRWGVEPGPVPCKTVWAEIDRSSPV